MNHQMLMESDENIISDAIIKFCKDIVHCPILDNNNNGQTSQVT